MRDLYGPQDDLVIEDFTRDEHPRDVIARPPHHLAPIEETEGHVSPHWYGPTDLDMAVDDVDEVAGPPNQVTLVGNTTFKIAYQYEDVTGKTDFIITDDCSVEDILLDGNLCDDLEYDELESSFDHMYSQCDLVDKTILNQNINNECELVNVEPSFNIVGMGKTINHSRYISNTDINIENSTPNFKIRDGLSWQESSSLNYCNTDCTLVRNISHFDIPITSDVELRSKSRFTTPELEYSSKSSTKFTIPDTNYKQRENKFHLYKDFKTFRDKIRHYMSSTFSNGKESTSFHIPQPPKSDNDQNHRKETQFQIYDDVIFCSDTKPKFVNLNDREGPLNQNKTKFIIPDSKTYKCKNKYVINKHSNKVFNCKLGKVKDATTEYVLLNGNRKYAIPNDCSFINNNINYDFNELEIDCSQISI